MNNNQIVPYQEAAAPAAPAKTVFADIALFGDFMTMATMLSKSSIVPKVFQNNPANCLIALEMAARLGMSPLGVLQNIYIVHERPSFSSSFIIGIINSCGRFAGSLAFDVSGTGDSMACRAWAVEKRTGEKIVGPEVSIAMAKKEGWFGKNGSKWQAMPELMIRYRAAAFFGRLYVSDLLMGMRGQDELEDTDGGQEGYSPEISQVADVNQAIKDKKAAKKQTEKVIEAEFSAVSENSQAAVEQAASESTPVATKEPVPPPAAPEPPKRQLQKVGKLKNDLMKIKDLAVLNMWIRGADEVLNREFVSEEDRAEVKAFAQGKAKSMADEAEALKAQTKKEPAPGLYSPAVIKEFSEVDVKKSIDALDLWISKHYARLLSNHGQEMTDVIVSRVDARRNEMKEAAGTGPEVVPVETLFICPEYGNMEISVCLGCDDHASCGFVDKPERA